ncbi:hypothetical protein SCOCK_10044 [Actinacidiphila cocklensis]|uniref:Uncharacterized protein n=1 Tax=Actinacidiphila cocklensis TaxID=887465 RepID=A0A9W4DME2_9ACTN|nr:hypothetical protein SCOCK_10044 [Actinacidiphila cocklensis]
MSRQPGRLAQRGDADGDRRLQPERPLPGLDVPLRRDRPRLRRHPVPRCLRRVRRCEGQARRLLSVPFRPAGLRPEVVVRPGGPPRPRPVHGRHGQRHGRGYRPPAVALRRHVQPEVAYALSESDARRPAVEAG